MASTKKSALANNPIVDLTAIPEERIIKQQARSIKHQAVKRQAAHRAASVECGPNHQAPSTEIHDDRQANRGSPSSHKV